MEYTKGTFKDGITGWKSVKYPETEQVGYSTHEIQWSDDGECVAEVVHGENEAKLMASAPIMYEALLSIAEKLSISSTRLNSEVWSIANNALRYVDVHSIK